MTFDLEVLWPREERNCSMVAFLPFLSCARNALHVMSPPAPLELDPFDEEPPEFELDELGCFEHPASRNDVAVNATNVPVATSLIFTSRSPFCSIVG